MTEGEFLEQLDNLFGISHLDPFTMLPDDRALIPDDSDTRSHNYTDDRALTIIPDDRVFLLSQRQKD